MYAEERRQRIADLTQSEGRVVVADLADHFGVTRETVRRDLDELEAAGVLRRVHGGAIATRTFIPHRCHKTIGVLGAVSVATACLIEGSPAFDLAQRGTGRERVLSVEHPTGEMTVVAQLDAGGNVVSAAILRTARKLMDGEVFA